MGKFDSYYDPPDYGELPCEMCGKMPDDCICPECVVCGSKGDKTCYSDHGMFKMSYQIESLKSQEAEWEKEALLGSQIDKMIEEDFKAWEEYLKYGV